MRPAFASTRQAAAFALLLLVLLLLPALLTKSILPSREQIYSSIWWENGAFPYIDEQIFAEKGDIDIAFVGPSHIWNAINTPYVQEKLSEKLGRPAVVRSICWGGAGYDELYFIVQDLLQHRKVHMVVFYDAYSESDMPNTLAPRWFRFGDNAEALRGLPLRFKASYYFASIIGVPRSLLGMIRSTLPDYPFPSERNYWEIKNKAESITSRLGSLAMRGGFTPNVSAMSMPFEVYTPLITANPSDACIYSESTKGMFRFTSILPSWQLHFARKFAGLADESKCKFVLLHLPVVAESRDTTINEREFWPEALHADIAMVGIPPAKLFDGMTDEQVKKLYADPFHFNKNGQDYFTPLVTTSLLDIYAAQKHN